MPILIKIASIDDVLALQAISKTTFLEAFAKSNTEADMALYLHEQLSEDQLRTELENPNSAFYFASINDQVIGYLKYISLVHKQKYKAMRLLKLNAYMCYSNFKISKLAPCFYKKRCKKLKNYKLLMFG